VKLGSDGDLAMEGLRIRPSTLVSSFKAKYFSPSSSFSPLYLLLPYLPFKSLLYPNRTHTLDFLSPPRTHLPPITNHSLSPPLFPSSLHSAHFLCSSAAPFICSSTAPNHRARGSQLAPVMEEGQPHWQPPSLQRSTRQRSPHPPSSVWIKPPERATASAAPTPNDTLAPRDVGGGPCSTRLR
jgi:hypothetical protein